MHLMHLLAITAARQSIDLANAYFVPDQMALDALADAARRGVQMRILVPGEHIDSETVRQASRAQWGPLLEAGAHIAEYQPTMFHVKGLVVDELVASVGSTNFDIRSFRLNDEANLNVLHRGLAQQQRQVFDADWRKARKVSLQAWQNRPLLERAQERWASLLRSQL
jgi:cardiolipin synthase A/B